MREIRLSGSEGGVAQLNAPSLPLSKHNLAVDYSAPGGSGGSWER